MPGQAFTNVYEFCVDLNKYNILSNDILVKVSDNLICYYTCFSPENAMKIQMHRYSTKTDYAKPLK